MKIDFTPKQYRRLLDLIYIGNWILNSTRGSDRLSDYDQLESYLFEKSEAFQMPGLSQRVGGEVLPSQAFAEGGIHEAIMDYEDTVFFEILAEELAHRDIANEGANPEPEELSSRIRAYIAEFERNGLLNLLVDADME